MPFIKIDFFKKTFKYFLTLFLAFGLLVSAGVFAFSETSDDVSEASEAGNAKESVSFEDLKGLKGAVKDGSIQDTVLIGLVEDPEICYYASMADECLALTQKKTDYALVIAEQYSAIAEEYEDLTLVPELSVPCGEIGYVFAKNSHGDELREEIDEYINTISESGELETLKYYWFTPGDKARVSIPTEGPKGTLKIATAATSPPFIYVQDDGFSGYEVSILASFAEEYGYGLSFVITDMNGLLPSVISGKCDLGANCLMMTDERKETVNFSEATSRPMYTILMRTETAASFTSVSESEKEDLNFFERTARSFKKTFITESRWKLILKGLITTVLLTLLSGTIGIFLGLLFYQIKVGKSRVLSKLIRAFNSIMAGTPMVVLLMIFYYLIFGNVAIPPFFVAVIAFSLNFASGASEIYYNCVKSIDIGQTEAALALGYTKDKAFFRFILPQALLRALPLIKGQLVNLLKGTAVVGFISIQDLTKMGDLVRSRTYDAFFPLIATAVIYYIFAWLIKVIMGKIELVRDPVYKRDKRFRKTEGENKE